MRKATNQEPFFFAETKASLYDDTIAAIVPGYYRMQHLSDSLLRDLVPSKLAEGHFLDVGSGTGAQSLALLKTFPRCRSTAIDSSASIQLVHREKMRTGSSRHLQMEQRCKLIVADIRQFRSAASLLGACGTKTKLSGAVTSLTVHHFTHAEKKEFYSLVYESLRPGGILLNADLFSYVNADVNAASLKFDLDWMEREFTAPSLPSVHRLSKGERMELLRLWRRHYRLDNRLEPLESSDKFIGQIEMLRKSGFARVEVPYRMSLSGIVIAIK